MKQINFSHEGGFPLEQETLEKLQTAYRSELFGALKAHLSIDTQTDYILAPATINTKGWAVIRLKEKDPKDPAGGTKMQGILYPIKEASPTGFLKATRTGTNLVYGTGVSQTAYFDYEAEYISAQDYTNRPESPESSDATTVNYYDLAQFQIVKDRKAIEGILGAINANIDAIQSNIDTIESNIDSVETAITVINQTYLPLNGSKAMTGDLNLDIYKLSKLDTKEGGFATVRAADFRLGSITRKGLLNPNDPTGRALADTSDESKTSLSLNYQSDWQNTSIGGKVYLENLSTTKSAGSLLVIDDYHQVTKSNSLPELLNRITVLESKISTATAAVPIGMVAIWGKPAPFPEGWQEYVPLRGKMPVGLYNPNANERTVQIGQRNNYENLTFYNNNGVFTWPFDTLGTEGGKVAKSLSIDEMPEHSHNITLVDEGGIGAPAGGNPNGITNGTSTTKPAGKNQSFSMLNPYRVVSFIEYTGNPSDQKAPTTPTNLEASKIGTKSLTLSWNASTDNVGVTNYLVYKESILLEIVASNVVSFPVTGLIAGTSYSFSVIARDAAGNLSTPATLTQATIAVDLTAPTIPNYLHCYTQGKGLIGIEWGTSTDDNGPITYELWRTVDGFAYFIFDTTNNTYSSDSGLPNSTYSYKVRARDSNGNMSAFTNEASITISSL
ncbi:fibronectin type III domain-containing protein [Flavobacterium psychroterrae]|uniref:Fibronectin type III domain-containing protein n=1 Tax=Flavobacterium psychroterrae TaxID=2133767 RepID=A0ABS5PH39_9FLAO|nr:fibronectin type III domain-containing protein [Flavobacterium psychroterrae]MBS7233639.1 fibronectin type III domain-containing protein [Flavobacterium psychroterrae]